jgi:hypothetical protein
VPAGLERVAIHEPTGLRAGFLCWGEAEWFLAGTAPIESCGPDWRDDERFERFERYELGDEPLPRRPPRRDPVARFFERLFRGIAEEAGRQR